MNAISDRSNAPEFPYRLWVSLTLLLIAEIIGVGLGFDGDSIPESCPWYSLVVQIVVLSRIGAVVVVATLLAAGPKWYRILTLESVRLAPSARVVLFTLANLSAFCCFWLLSVPVFGGGASPDRSHWAFFAAWIVMGFATLICWCLAVLPWSVWSKLVTGSSKSLLAGALLGISAYAAGRMAQDQWKPLAKVTLLVVHQLLRLGFSGTVVVPEDAVVGTSVFQVEISPECSGYEGMGLIAVLFSVALWTFRRDFRFPRAFLLLPLAMALMWVANAGRITALVALGTWGYPELAVGGFHSLAGSVLFLLIGLGLFAAAHRMPFFSSLHHDIRARRESLDAAYLMPAMAIIATAMVTSAFSPGLDRYYPARVIAVTIALLIYRKQYTELRPKCSWEAVTVGFAVFGLWMVLEPGHASASMESPVRLSLESIPHGWMATWLIFRVVGSVIMVPLAEELAFRGYLMRRLISSDFQSVPPGRLTWFSFLVSSVLFGALHGRWLAGTLAGMAFALLYHRRGELADAIVAHGVANALIAAAVLATGAWSLWA